MFDTTLRAPGDPATPTLVGMGLSARDVGAELRRRLPGVGAVKLHKLLYYTQGHHLAAFGVPLFEDSISAWDMGPVVGSLWHAEREGLTDGDPPASMNEAELNTIGYVVSRYGALSGTDLRHLTHSERPWRDANRRRRTGTSVRIANEAIEDYFRTADLDEGSEGGPEPLDADTVAAWLKNAAASMPTPARPDSIERLRARLTRDVR